MTEKEETFDVYHESATDLSHSHNTLPQGMLQPAPYTTVNSVGLTT